MNKALKAMIGLCGAAITMCTNCKKSSTATVSTATDSVRNIIAGSWGQSHVFADSNGNGIMDANEEVTGIAFSASYHSLTFYASGAAADTFYTGHYNGTAQYNWALTNNNADLKLTGTGNNAGQITYYPIDSLSVTTMILRDTCASCSPKTKWTIYTKR